MIDLEKLRESAEKQGKHEALVSSNMRLAIECGVIVQLIDCIDHLRRYVDDDTWEEIKDRCF